MAEPSSLAATVNLGLLSSCTCTNITIAISVVLILFYITRSFLSKLHIANVTSRHVFITGCDTGFGNLLARTLDAKGVHVFAACLTENGAQDLAAVSSSRLRTVIVDIAKEESVKSALKFVQENLPPDGGLWGLVNNAGVMNTIAPAEYWSISEFKNTCDVNLFGTISVTLTFLPLVKRAQGRVVTVCSIGGTVGFPGTSAYAVSKAAIKMFCSTLRRELYNSGVTIHNIEPGTFSTNLVAGQRMRAAYEPLYTRASPDLQEYYGGHIAKFLYYSFENVDPWASAKIHLVADSMAHALLARYPRQQYVVVSGIWILLRVFMYLPEWIVDALISWPKPYGPRFRPVDT